MEPPKPLTATAIFAGGCFWCMQADFEQTPGVVSVTAGYTGGAMKNPTYQQVSSGMTGHAEAVKVVYSPDKIAYVQLLTVFWDNIDPTDAGGQFYDRGTQYRTAIFYSTEDQRILAEASKQKMEDKFKKIIATEIVPAGEFYPAEDYHQDYYKKNPIRYKAYKMGSGREERLKEIWGTK